MGFTPEIPTRLSDNNHIISLRFSVRLPVRLGDKVLCLFPFKNVVNVRPTLQVLRQARKQEPRDLPRHVWLLAGLLSNCGLGWERSWRTVMVCVWYYFYPRSLVCAIRTPCTKYGVVMSSIRAHARVVVDLMSALAVGKVRRKGGGECLIVCRFFGYCWYIYAHVGMAPFQAC